MKTKKPIYMYQCVKCRKTFLTEDNTFRHCGMLTSWVNGVEGKGVNVNSPIVKIKVSGYVTMTRENLNNILAYDDPHTGLVYSLHMGYVNADNMEFDPEEE